MLVTQVTELSKSRSKVYIDQEFAFVLYKGELRLYHIKRVKNSDRRITGPLCRRYCLNVQN